MESQRPKPQARIQRQAGQRAELPPRHGEPVKDFKDEAAGNPKTSPALATEEHVLIMSMLTPEEVKNKNGLPGQAVMASFRGGKPPAQLRGNPPFLKFLQDFMNQRLLIDPEVIRAALDQREGYLYLIDLNTPDGVNGRVPPEDIIGCIKVTGGKLVPGSYEACSSYLVYREGRGLMQLPPSLHMALHEAMLALPPCPPS